MTWTQFLRYSAMAVVGALVAGLSIGLFWAATQLPWWVMLKLTGP